MKKERRVLGDAQSRGIPPPNVMGGSIVLNPKGQHYTQLKSPIAERHRNEYFAVDAEVLLSNSQDFFSRTVVLNHNANVAVTFLQSKIDSDPDCVLTKVRYPGIMPSKHLYDDLMRGPTEEIPQRLYRPKASKSIYSIKLY
ncbi:hypothetical protein ACO1O0_000101 [Amphichorda felina]